MYYFRCSFLLSSSFVIFSFYSPHYFKFSITTSLLRHILEHFRDFKFSSLYILTFVIHLGTLSLSLASTPGQIKLLQLCECTQNAGRIDSFKYYWLEKKWSMIFSSKTKPGDVPLHPSPSAATHGPCLSYGARSQQTATTSSSSRNMIPIKYTRKTENWFSLFVV